MTTTLPLLRLLTNSQRVGHMPHKKRSFYMEVDKKEFYDYLSSLVGIPFDDHTLIFADLGIAGLDCDIFMENIFEKYNVDHTTYNHDLYYVDDMGLGGAWHRFINNEKRLPEHLFSALHLYDVVVNEKWFYPK